MTTLLVTHPSCLDHVTPPGHPERSDRLRAIESALDGGEFKLLKRIEAPQATLEAVELCHSEQLVDDIRDIAPKQGFVQIDADTTMSPGTFEAILRSTGGALAAADAVMTGAARNAFVATRPPGHHAEMSRPMGFCFFNNAAIAARHVQRTYGIGRAAIVDFDVHHGNGTQDIFWSDETVMYCSTHEMPLFPGTGKASERGEHDNIVNVPLAAGDGGAVFRDAFETRILPRLREFAPEFLVISAGFDAHYRDPLGGLKLEATDFAWATSRVKDVANASAGGRVISVLEGGYDLQGLAESVAAHVATLMMD